MTLRFAPLTLLVLCALSAAPTLAARADAARVTDRAALEALAQQFRARMAERQDALYLRLRARASGPQGALNRNPDLRLMFVDAHGMPRFYTTENLNAAISVNTDDVWPGGSAGYALSGAGTAPGELGEWDAGGVRTTHQELAGRAAQMDAPAGLHSHSTHVAGTLIAGGVYGPAKGMSYQGTLAAYDWNDDAAEMATAAAAGMLASNHSYGFATGWLFNLDGSGRWFWLGDTTVSATEDYGFGFYDVTAQTWDQVAYDAPNYLIVKSAGNDRNDFAPAQPDSHYIWDPGIEDWVFSMTVRNSDGAPNGYDTIAWHGVAKNILTVGAVNDVIGGWSSPASVTMTSFSAWGPTDDGRIKPDLVANGAGLISCVSSGDANYGSSSGTSMASPNACGSINLLSHYWRTTHGGATPRAATMKAIVLHTANATGTSGGPDYSFGWGLLNTSGAADVITADTQNRVREETLLDGTADTYVLQHPGGPLRVTIAWTDPPGTPVAPALDPPDLMLVNDLDLRVTETATATTHLPWVLDPAAPASPATFGDNTRDNVERVEVAAAPAGEYQVVVRHKGTLTNGSQDYSIVASGELDVPANVDVDAGGAAASFAIGAATPNPFDAATRLEFTLPARADVAVGIYDLGGRRVRDLGHGSFEAGRHALTWDGRDERGAPLPAGVYFARVSANGEGRVRRLVRLD